jgi:AraC family transcriptional regulator of adaptative response / DNA-3-methyladenine glycosylase II
MTEDFERCYRAVRSRDPRFDGWFITAVTSTGIYCRPSCPAVTPRRENVRFLRSAAAAQRAGFRACKRCRPDASPGSPEWNMRADVVGRAMRLIADGSVDRDGVTGLARRLGYSERHLHRQLVAELGAGPLALARAQRAQTARLLIETTALPFTEVAFAAGFPSIRQFNETVREVYATTPTELRRAAAGMRAKQANGSRSARAIDGADANGAHAATPSAATTLALRLRYRAPLDAAGLLGFLGQRAVPGVEELAGATYRRVLALPHGPGVVALTPAPDHVRCELRLTDLRDLAAAVQRCRRLLDLDADPAAVAEALGADPLIGGLVRDAPGRRVPGAADGAELAVRAVLGQQISVAGARTLAGRLTATLGVPLPAPDGALTHAFPSAAAIAGADPDSLPLTRARRHALKCLCTAIARGDVTLDPGADRAETRERLLVLPGIGPWTIEYVAMRALGDPDALPVTDLGIRHAVERLGQPVDPSAVAALAERWRPWRAYAVQHLWASLTTREDPDPATRPAGARTTLGATTKRRRLMLTTTIPTPPGPLTLIATDDAILASGWTSDPETLLPLIGAALRPAALTPRRDLGPFTRAVRDYVAGDLAAIDAVPVKQAASPFLARAWAELRAIPAGAPETYAQLAARCERPAAVRAAGSACARNPTALFVPCHRIVRTGGGLGGFAYGLDVKRWLLGHEAHAVGAVA